ncbi:hypothetical protein DSC91_000538 [Paraburkholderia caffeinilytica]|uniref:Uncharacterized protein n=2 Tax=Paraburkholderia caffeinilytica TaxID=1761016 RepID=A0ABQ1N5T5_9BURK|nr:hypothetical protein DSC91_000538 [Paraburkholderia caffeinilytica]GGC54962.1 hypothetical protein GCM10011400_48320 [Paraburkholderia caffeinilytica]CAB3785086.1 hypothetical protein LMG28690_01935 [Paraburkholderia caffeinilytica]
MPFRRAAQRRRPLRTHYIERGSTFTYMKHFFSSVLLALTAAVLPLGSHAAALDAPLICNESGHQFIADLAQQQMIDPKPMRVESNSINAFSPAQGADLTAFGFHVFAVVGYEKDDPMFRVGDGEPVARSAYGVVVFGGESKVQNALAEAGSTAIVHRVAPLVTAIFCKRS